jgi:quinol monooxygenase YgiN
VGVWLAAFTRGVGSNFRCWEIISDFGTFPFTKKIGQIMRLVALFLVSLLPGISYAGDHADSISNKTLGDNPFVLIARVQVKEGMVDQYLKIADAVDNAVEETEPGMLLHNFDADPNDPLAFTWTEVYKNSEAFLLHTANEPVLKYVDGHAEFGEGFAIEIYGNVSKAVLSNITELGFPLKHFKTTKVGYARTSLTD